MPGESGQAVQLQWGLESTVNKSLSIALNFVRIAAADNVQPFALLACEKFGNTLPICRATRKEIEKEARPRREPVLLSFARAMIKPGGGEAITQLSSNLAGLNFLALAAALVSTSGLKEASETIHRMIDHSAAEKDVVPAEFHVLNILEVLEPRLSRMGFLEMCYVWDRWLSQHEHLKVYASHNYPSSASVEKLVVALRSLLRIGDDEAQRVVITPYSCTSWILAFIEWCTGLSPNACDASGNVVLAQPESAIMVVLPLNPSQITSTKVELFTTTQSLLESIVLHASLDEYNKLRWYHGMVTVQTHGQQALHELQSNVGIGQEAMLEALPYALQQCLQLIRPRLSKHTCDEDEKRKEAVDRWYSGTDEKEVSWIHLLPEFFSAEKVICTMRTYVGEHTEKLARLKTLPLSTTITDLPILKQWAHETEDTCLYCDLTGRNKVQGRESDSTSTHLTDHILHRVCIVAANILALSLVDTALDDVRLRFDGGKYSTMGYLPFVDVNSLLGIMQKVLINRRCETISANYLMADLRRLLGHEEASSAQLIASSSRGQVLFPRMFETMMVIPGILVYTGQTHGPRYHGVVGKSRHQVYSTKPMVTVPSEQMLRPSQFNSLTHEWRVHVEDNYIVTALSKKDASGRFIEVNPFRILDGMSGLIFAKSCPHDPDARLDGRVEDCRFIHPNNFFSMHVPEHSGENAIHVFASRGNDALRMMITSAVCEKPLYDVRGTVLLWVERPFAVIGQRACFNCSLSLCRRFNCGVLIC